jgi:predicted rRNA methylase YqxC with S4 and FtsJ domains
MTLRERYMSAEIEFLVSVIERSEDYTPEALATAREVMQVRRPDPAQVLKASRAIIQQKIDAYLSDFSVWSDALILPRSVFLNEEEVLLLFRSCFAARKNEFDDMIPEAWKYAIGGI